MAKSVEQIEGEKRLRGWLRYVMRVRDLDQPTVAKRLGVKQPTVSRLLSGKHGFGFGVLLRLKALADTEWVKLMEEPDPDSRLPSPGPPTARTAGPKKAQGVGGSGS